jgi:hypothetical protein
MKEVTLDVDSTQALLTLPSLTELAPWMIEPRCFPLLRSFVHLHQLVVSSGVDMLDEAAVLELLSSLRAMPELTSFDINGAQSNHTARGMLVDGLASAAPQLRELTFRKFAAMPPLAVLSGCAHLRKLYLHLCPITNRQSADDVLQLLRSLRHIEHVDVYYCEWSLSDDQRAQVTPPSVLVPSLKHFSWT